MFKDLIDVVILIKKEYKEIKVGRISFWLSHVHFNSFPLLPPRMPYLKEMYVLLLGGFCPYILKSSCVIGTCDFQLKHVYFKKMDNVAEFLLFLSESNMIIAGNFVPFCSFYRDM